ncbi:MAG: saccharopine dehydrogenase family protein, partial [Zetaproteobacteria bacterium]
MTKALIIGAGGVGRVGAYKCAEMRDVFDEVVLASRTLAKCEAIARTIEEKLGRTIRVHRLDLNEPGALDALLAEERPDVVVHLGLPYHDLVVMDACARAGAHYLDTANYEPEDEPRFRYAEQWARDPAFREAGITGVLGCGFDPGVTNVFCAWALKHHFDAIETIDILDCNAGEHDLPFATNFNPELNIREITQNGRYWEDGRWVETKPLEIAREFPFPEIGPRKMYLLYHEELESLSKHIPGLRRIRFWMTFSDRYLEHLRVIQNLGLHRVEPIEVEGVKVRPVSVLKALLPDPATLGARTRGKTCIGCIITGTKNGRRHTRYIYNICDHEAAWRETGAQAVSYTTGVPAAIGARLIATGAWRKPGVWNIEQLDPDPFMEELPRWGLPWRDEP